MYKLLFVDDESIIREGISSVISWKDIGFELVSMLENGLQAIEYIRKNPVDIVLSDIKMPKVDGLQLSKVIHEEFPEITVLLLSGYDDFEYAQEALKYHVSEFLLKPITAEELTRVLTRMHEKLDDQRDEQENRKELEKRLNESLPLLRERFLYRLVSGRIDRGAIEERKAYFQWMDLEGLYQVMVVSIPEDINDLDRLALSQFITRQKQEGDELLYNRDDNFVLILQDFADLSDRESVEAAREKLKQRSYGLGRKIFSFLQKRTANQGGIGCGEVVDSLEHLVTSYRGANSAVEYVRVIGTAKILHISEIRNRQSISHEEFSLLSEQLVKVLKTGRREETGVALDTIFTYFEKHYLTLHEASLYLMRLQTTLQDFMQELGLVQGAGTMPFQADYFVSINQARGFFRKLISDIEEKISDKRFDNTRSRVARAKQIIANRYADKNFSLQDICDELFLSTSQFSVLFKDGTGMTFVEYLTDYRVEQAQALLKNSSMRAYEVAELVGFNDPRYFSIIFKKVSGMTPMEYRRSIEE